jgi:hypothetical protein
MSKCGSIKRALHALENQMTISKLRSENQQSLPPDDVNCSDENNLQYNAVQPS